jgi:hypothetical protein
MAAPTAQTAELSSSKGRGPKLVQTQAPTSGAGKKKNERAAQ